MVKQRTREEKLSTRVDVVSKSDVSNLSIRPKTTSRQAQRTCMSKTLRRLRRPRKSTNCMNSIGRISSSSVSPLLSSLSSSVLFLILLVFASVTTTASAQSSSSCYSDLEILKQDIVAVGTASNGTDGGTFVVCPSTFFNFSESGSGPIADDDDLLPFDDDLLPFDDDAATPPPDGDVGPIVLFADNTTLQCGTTGSSANACIFTSGAFHISMQESPSDILIQGITFRAAEDSSIVTSGQGGSVVFRDCLWENNAGSGAILQVARAPDNTTMAPSTGLPSMSPSTDMLQSLAPSISSSPSTSHVPTASQAPTLSASPSTSRSPSADPSQAPSNSVVPTSSVAPSSLTSQTPSTSVPPSSSVAPSLGLTSQAPSNSAAPSTSAAPSISAAPSTSTAPSSSPSTSLKPTTSTMPSASPRPTVTVRPSVSTQPSLMPSVSSDPTTFAQPTGDQNPSSASPSSILSSGAPTAMVGSSAMPSGVSSLAPTLSSRPSVSAVPSLTPSTRNVPSTSQAPSVVLSPTIGPSASLSPSLSPSSSSSPSGSASPSASPSVSESPSTSNVPSVISNIPSNQPSGQEGDAMENTPPVLESPSASPIENNIETENPTAVLTFEPTTTDDLLSLTANDDFPFPDDRTVEKMFENWGRRRLMTGLEITVEDCVFSGNVNSVATFVNFQGVLRLIRTLFIGNEALNSVVAVYQGTLELTNCSFVENTFQLSPGPVFLDSESTMTSNEGNCEFDNIAGDAGAMCDGVFKKTDPGLCTDPSSCQGACSSFTSLECTVISCIETWSELSNALSSPSSREVFQLCNRTLFDISDQSIPPISIRGGRTIIQCGQDGKRSNGCLVLGGETQFRIGNASSNVEFHGLTLLSSSRTSVEASSDASSSALFVDCEFAGHTGLSVVQMYSGDINRTDAGVFPSPLARAMTATWKNCSFADNTVSDAVISNFNGGSNVEGSLFIGNTGLVGTVLGLFGAYVNITSSCFVSNNSTTLPGTVFIQKGSSIYQDLFNFGTGNAAGDFECVDIFRENSDSCLTGGLCNGTCSSFYSSTCAVKDISPVMPPTVAPSQQLPSMSPSQRPSSNGCFSVWPELSRAVSAASMAGRGGIFSICPGAMMNVDLFPSTAISPIVIGASDIVIQCGESGRKEEQCVVFGGLTQFELRGSVSGVQFRGLSLVGARASSVNAFGNSEASASFTDCTLAGNVGSSAVVLYRGDGLIPVEATTGVDLPLLQDPGMTLTFTDCSFDDNMVTYAVLLNIGGRLALHSCVFRGNNAMEGVVSVHQNGTLSLLSGSCFVGNTATASGGVLLVGATSELIEFEDNFGLENNVVDSICHGALVKGNAASSDVCVEFDSDSCGIFDNTPQPSPSPSGMSSTPSEQPSTGAECFSEWDMLSIAIQTAGDAAIGGVFSVCPNTTLSVRDYPDPQITPIPIYSSNITVQCGPRGRQEDNCVVDGGTQQFIVRDFVTGVRFLGLTFTGSSILSINGGATPESEMNFVNCQWTEHTGNSAVQLLYVSPGRKSMFARFRDCIWANNSVVDAAVLNYGGQLVIRRGLFEKNDAQGGAITMVQVGKADISDSCFVNNVATSKRNGAVNLLDDAVLETNINNFAAGNSGGCNGALTLGNPPESHCDDMCEPFEATTCAIADFPPAPSFPSVAPATTPPACAPSGSPSVSAVPTVSLQPSGTVPTAGPSMYSSASWHPSEQPSVSPSIFPTMIVTPDSSFMPSALPSPAPSDLLSSESPSVSGGSMSMSYSYDYFFTYNN